MLPGSLDDPIHVIWFSLSIRSSGSHATHWLTQVNALTMRTVTLVRLIFFLVRQWMELGPVSSYGVRTRLVVKLDVELGVGGQQPQTIDLRFAFRSEAYGNALHAAVFGPATRLVEAGRVIILNGTIGFLLDARR